MDRFRIIFMMRNMFNTVAKVGVYSFLSVIVLSILIGFTDGGGRVFLGWMIPVSFFVFSLFFIGVFGYVWIYFLIEKTV